MRWTNILLLFLFLSIPFQVYTQIRPAENYQRGIYQDRITDEYGSPQAGLKVSVRGKGIHTYSDNDGNFSIKASLGDEIVISRNGVLINSYRLDGSLNYEIQDLSVSETSEAIERKSNKKFSSTRRNEVSYLDSAIFYAAKDPYRSIEFVEQQLQSNKNNSKSDLARSFTLLGDNYMQLQQYDLAVSNYQTALKNSFDIDLQIKYAKALSKNKQYISSDKTYKSILKQKTSPWQELIVNEGLGNNAKSQLQPNRAKLYFEEALKISEKNSISNKTSILNVKIAEILASTGEKNKSNIYLQNTIETAASGQIQKRAQVQNKVAEVYQSNKEYDKEIQVRKQTLNELEEAQIESIPVEVDDESETEVTTSQLNLDIGRAYIDKEEYDKAIPYLEKSAAEAEKGDNLEVQKDAIQKLSELYKKVGNSNKALQNYQEYARLVDELYTQKEDEIQASVILNNELRDKQNRINSLEKDRELSESRYKLTQSEQELTIANYRRQKLLIYALLSGLLLLGIAMFYMYRSNKQRRLANNLLALKSLRSQMNPHFIFNALNSVNSFIAQNDERTANRYLTDFSTLMRNVLENSEEDFITLSKEIELLKLYIQLEHSRFKDKFDYNITIDEKIQTDDFLIPPMLLQPYVENAVWHGLRYKKAKGNLQIDFQQKNSETILITITDDGIGRKKSKELKTQNQKKQQSKGMNNIKKRISILNEMYADKVDVKIEDLQEDESGTKVVLVLKKD